jgi:hypothetical protein
MFKHGESWLSTLTTLYVALWSREKDAGFMIE